MENRVSDERVQAPCRRVVALVTAGMILAGGISFGVYEAVTHLGGPTEVLTPGDDTSSSLLTGAGVTPVTGFTGPFPSDVASPGTIVHSRTVVTRAGQALSMTLDLWWDASSGRYRLERRFGSYATPAAAQVFTGDRLKGFQTTGYMRSAFDYTYAAYEEHIRPAEEKLPPGLLFTDVVNLGESLPVDPTSVAGMESARVSEAARLVAAGALVEVGRSETEGRVLIRYRGAASASDAGAAPTGTAPEREILVDQRSGLVVEESVVEQGQVVYQASRDYETVDSDEFESLVSLAIPPDFVAYTDADITPDTHAARTMGQEVCSASLSDLSNWMPFPIYHLGETFMRADGRRLVVGYVGAGPFQMLDEFWSGLSPTLEDIAGPGGGLPIPPRECIISYRLEGSDQATTDGAGLHGFSLLEQDSAPVPGQSSVIPSVSELKERPGGRDIQVNGWTDTLYSVDNSDGSRCLFYLARRGATTIVMEALSTTTSSDVDEQALIAVGAALRPYPAP